MQDATEVVTRYLEAFNEMDSGRRQELLEALYTADCSYTDPHVDLRGTGQIGGFIEQTREQFPGVTFTLGGPVDAHHNQARFQWHAGPPEQPDAHIGFDVIVTENGRIRSVYGFTDAAPSA